MIKIHTLPSIRTTALLTSLIITVAIGCTTSKDLKKSAEKTTSEVEQRLRDSLHVMDIQYRQLKSDYAQLQYSQVMFDSSKCPPIPELKCPDDCKDSTLKAKINELNDVIRSLNGRIAGLNNKVRVLADGTIEAEGNIRSATMTKEAYARIVETVTRKYDSVRAVESNLREIISKKTTVKEVHKKTGWSVFFLLFIIGAISGYVVRPYIVSLLQKIGYVSSIKH